MFECEKVASGDEGRADSKEGEFYDLHFGYCLLGLVGGCRSKTGTQLSNKWRMFRRRPLQIGAAIISVEIDKLEFKISNIKLLEMRKEVSVLPFPPLIHDLISLVM